MRADTIHELAPAIRNRQGPKEVVAYASGIRMAAESLAGSIEAFNRAAERGRDPEFDRNGTLLASIVTPPFYATEVWAGGSWVPSTVSITVARVISPSLWPSGAWLDAMLRAPDDILVITAAGARAVLGPAHADGVTDQGALR